MLFQKIALVSALAAISAAQDIRQNDIPRECTAICADVVSLAQRCEDTTSMYSRIPKVLHSLIWVSDDDAAEVTCICRAPNAFTLVPACEACVAEFDQDDSDADDVSADENGT
jgi:hypothetical protein